MRFSSGMHCCCACGDHLREIIIACSFAPANKMVPAASNLVCWCQNQSVNGFVAMCCGRCCARFGVESRHDDWRGVWRLAWSWASTRL